MHQSLVNSHRSNPWVHASTVPGFVYDSPRIAAPSQLHTSLGPVTARLCVVLLQQDDLLTWGLGNFAANPGTLACQWCPGHFVQSPISDTRLVPEGCQQSPMIHVSDGAGFTPWCDEPSLDDIPWRRCHRECNPVDTPRTPPRNLIPETVRGQVMAHLRSLHGTQLLGGNNDVCWGQSFSKLRRMAENVVSVEIESILLMDYPGLDVKASLSVSRRAGLATHE